MYRVKLSKNKKMKRRISSLLKYLAILRTLENLSSSLNLADYNYL